jgi:lipoprotein-releasing system ATP-binding protein
MYPNSTAGLNEQSVPAVLRVSDLWKGFRGRAGERIEVLRGVTFSVSTGEVIAVTGASGAGKSTLLHVLGGLETTDRGSIEWAPLNHEGTSQTTAKPAGSPALPFHCRVGFVFQFHYLLPDLSAFENVALPLMIARFDRAERERQARLCLEELGLAGRLTERIGNLSGGEQQRVAVARALIARPGLVLADEPTGNLDASTGDEIGQLLINYCRQQGAIGVIATHNEHLAQRCDRVLTLRQGQLMSGEL